MNNLKQSKTLLHLYMGIMVPRHIKKNKHTLKNQPRLHCNGKWSERCHLRLCSAFYHILKAQNCCLSKHSCLVQFGLKPKLWKSGFTPTNKGCEKEMLQQPGEMLKGLQVLSTTTVVMCLTTVLRDRTTIAPLPEIYSQKGLTEVISCFLFERRHHGRTTTMVLIIIIW